VRTLLIANFFIVLTSMPYMMMLPGFVKQVLDGGPDKLGLLISITGIGSLAGSLVIASMPPKNRGKILLFGSGLLGVALIGFSLSNIFWVTAIIMVFIGLGQTTRMSLSNVLIQAYVEDEYRGRVMSIYMMEFSLMQFGVFAVGILASVIGIQYALTFTSVLLLIFLVYAYLFIPRLRNLD
jgi:predicted MFS family arabinose efflux permease